MSDEFDYNERTWFVLVLDGWELISFTIDKTMMQSLVSLIRICKVTMMQLFEIYVN